MNGSFILHRLLCGRNIKQTQNQYSDFKREQKGQYNSTSRAIKHPSATGHPKVVSKERKQLQSQRIIVFKSSRYVPTQKHTLYTVKGVQLWNNCNVEMKTCRSLSQFKQMNINLILSGYSREKLKTMNEEPFCDTLFCSVLFSYVRI